MRKTEKIEGKHPPQKQEYLLEHIILASPEKGQIAMNPFCGSGTTRIKAVKCQKI